MGEVWRAHDPKLRRDVAIKALPPEVSADSERRRRFERESRLLATVNHPNVAAIYGVEEEGGERFLVLELVEGATLAERLAAKPLPLSETLAVCVQIAAGLEAAHVAGIIHRDLKPSNIKLRPDGAVKVLDLGLARVVETPTVNPEDASTLTGETTRTGALLGTPGYMSPEQTRGLPLDRRSDIFSFGCVLYECLTGKSAFVRAAYTDTLAAVLTSDPDWGALPATLPRRVGDLLRRCLRKDLRQRLHDIADARIELEDAQGGAESESGTYGAPAAARLWSASLRWALGGLLLGILIGFLAGELRRPIPLSSSPSVRATLHMPPGITPIGLTASESIALSPDGRTVVFQGRMGEGYRLYRRALDGTTVEPLPGTENGFAPFFSPDGEWLAFFTVTHLLKVPTAGGAPLKICEVPPVTRGGTWAPDGRIIFAPQLNHGLWSVPEGGGETQPFTRLAEGEHAHLHPQILPGGWILFAAVAGQDFQDLTSSRILAFNPGSGERRLILDGSVFARYVGNGWIVFARGDDVFAAPFDTQTLRAIAPPVKAPETIALGLDYRVPQFDVSPGGTLVFASGPPSGDPTTEVLSVDRRGHESSLPVPSGIYQNPLLSPNGRRLALVLHENFRVKVSVFDLDRQVFYSVTPEPGRFFDPVWSPDGGRLAFTSYHRSTPRLAVKAADGSGPIELLTPATEDAEFPTSWSPDGRTIAYTIYYSSDRGDTRGRGTTDIWFAASDRSNPPRAWMETPYSEMAAAFSPDGRFLAYVSDESGKYEVFVRPVIGGGKVQISSGGGTEPLWGRGGEEILYRQENRFLAVQLDAGPEPVPGPPRLLFERTFDSFGASASNYRDWDISRDGMNILALRTTRPREPSLDLVVVTGWLAELERLRQRKAVATLPGS